MFMSLMPTELRRRPQESKSPEIPGDRVRPDELGERRARATALAWAGAYTYLLIVAPPPDPDAVITTVQNVLGWVFTAALLTVFVSAFMGRRATGITAGASAIGGGALSYMGIDCLMAGHTDTMFYVMALAGGAFVLYALSMLRAGRSAQI